MQRLLVALLTFVAFSLPAFAQPAPSPEALRDLAPSGKLRAALNFGNGVLVQGEHGAPRGVTPDLAKELAKRLGVPLEFVNYTSAGRTFAGMSKGEADVGFIAIEPARAAEMEFTAPYVIIEGTYMVRKDSSLKDVEDVDKPGIRIGVGQGSVYDLFLTRTLKHATLVRNPKGGADGGIAPFVEGRLDAAAGVRQPLDPYAKDHPEMRVMTGAFDQIRQAMGTPKGRLAGLAYLRVFIEQMKANGFVAEALKRSGQVAKVGPPEKP
jgi:polar amino acid transport system substrate-binding protein